MIVRRMRMPDPRERKLLPPRHAGVFLDTHYVMCAAGVLSQVCPDAALAVLLESTGVARPGGR